jgi:hypothetical protein
MTCLCLLVHYDMDYLYVLISGIMAMILTANQDTLKSLP